MMNDNKTDEQRSTVRIPIDDEICVIDVSTKAILGTVANIHKEGFMVISDGGLKEDAFYEVIFENSADSENPNGIETPDVSLSVECLWISETGTGDQIWAGFQIGQLNPESDAYLDKLIAHYDE